MSNYSREKHIKFLNTFDENGVIDQTIYKEVEGYTRTMKKGAQMTYTYNIEKVLLELNGKKEKEIFFYIMRQFTKRKTEVVLDQQRLVRKFDTSQQYVSKVINKLCKSNFLMKIRSKPKLTYRMNPYFVIPSYSSGIELQDEWDILIGAQNHYIKDKFEYLSYIGSDEWKELSNRLKEKYKQCNQCGSEKLLEAHHITYENLYNEKDEDIEILCHDCHIQTHQKQKENK